MSLVSAACALAVALVLLAAGAGHLRDARGTRTALAAHDVLPSGLRGMTAAVLPVLELLLGMALLAGLMVGLVAPTGARPGGLDLVPAAAGAAALLLAGFTAYLALVVRRTRGVPDVPCGCGLGATPVGHWAVLRAAVLLVLALAAALGGAQAWSSLPTDQAPLAAQAAVVIAAGVSLALAAAALPAARAVPSALTTLHPAGGAR